MTVYDSGRSPTLQRCKAITAILQDARRFDCKNQAESRDGGRSPPHSRTQLRHFIPAGRVSGLRQSYSRENTGFSGRPILQDVAETRVPGLQGSSARIGGGVPA